MVLAWKRTNISSHSAPKTSPYALKLTKLSGKQKNEPENFHRELLKRKFFVISPQP
jgi:hypothetical protein